MHKSSYFPNGGESSQFILKHKFMVKAHLKEWHREMIEKVVK
jgi:hypothetical protein